MYTDPTGRFLVPSTKVNDYILCGYYYDSNHVFAEPMKNRKKASQIKAFTTIIKKMKAAGQRPTFHILDNEVSTDLIAFLKSNENITVQLDPDRCHRRNAAERAIITLKNHFISGLCTAHQHSPFKKWYSLLPQAVITFNLLHTSRLNPKLSALTSLTDSTASMLL